MPSGFIVVDSFYIGSIIKTNLHPKNKVMKINTNGLSRLVFVFKNHVVKVPWINLFLLFKIYTAHKNKGLINSRLKRYHKNKIIAFAMVLFNCFVGSLYSNRREYLYYQKHKNELSLLPIKGYLMGNIIVQPRAEVFKETDLRWKNFLLKIKERNIDERADLSKAMNFCVYNNEIKLLDYANKVAQEVLNTRGFWIISEKA